jgi:hypothetical protein
MEKIEFKKNEMVLGHYYVTEEKEYEPSDLVPCAIEENGIAIVAYQANYLKFNEHV